MTTTGYNPVVSGIPTDATIYTGLKVTEGQMKQLSQDIPVIDSRSASVSFPRSSKLVFQFGSAYGPQGGQVCTLWWSHL